jgi:hypothetical protein
MPVKAGHQTALNARRARGSADPNPVATDAFGVTVSRPRRGWRMGSTLHFIEAPGPHSGVVEWFRRLPQCPEETPTAYGMVLYFRSFGPLVFDNTGAIDATRSPVVTIVLPTVRRAILWTVGAVHFRSTLRLEQNKAIAKVARSFSKWIKGHEQVYDPSVRAENPFAYYLEGSAKNWGAIYGLPSGLEHLRRQGYFVSHKDNDVVLDRVCRALRLRGVTCGPASH